MVLKFIGKSNAVILAVTAANTDLANSEVWAALSAQGWCDAAALFEKWTGIVPELTCKMATRPDRILLSPGLCAHLRKCEVRGPDAGFYSDHRPVIATFDVHKI